MLTNHKTAKKFNTSSVIKVGILFTGLTVSFLSAATVFLVSLTTPLSGYDAAYNMQVAYSLADEFIYAPNYHKIVYAPEITTNGAIQYLLAAAMSIFGERVGLSLVLAVVVFLLFVGTFALSRSSFIVLTTLFLFWSPFFSLSIQFLGEVFSAACIVFGLFFLFREKELPKVRFCFDYLPLITSGIFFSLATQTKLVSLLVVFPIALGAVLSQSTLGVHSYKTVPLKLLAILLPSIAFFVIGYVFSAWHSWQSIGAGENEFRRSSLTDFLMSHLRQTTSRENSAPWDYMSDSHIILPIMIASGAFLVIWSLWWTPLIFVVSAYLFTGGANDRRVFLFTLILLIIAASEYGRRSIRRMPGSGQDNGSKRTRSISALATASITLHLVLAFSSISNQEIVFQKTASSISALAKELSTGQFSSKHVIPASQASMIQNLKAIEDPILTSGWWQFPEYGIWGELEFHDRMDLDLPERLGSRERLYLLFDESINAWPETSVDLCSREIYRDDTIVLCLFRDDVPLNTLD